MERDEVEELWDLFSTFFVNEYQNIDVFIDYLQDKDVILIYENINHTLIGFIIIRFFGIEIQGRYLNIIEGVSFVFRTDCRGLLVVLVNTEICL